MCVLLRLQLCLRLCQLRGVAVCGCGRRVTALRLRLCLLCALLRLLECLLVCLPRGVAALLLW